MKSSLILASTTAFSIVAATRVQLDDGYTLIYEETIDEETLSQVVIVNSTVSSSNISYSNIIDCDINGNSFELTQISVSHGADNHFDGCDIEESLLDKSWFNNCDVEDGWVNGSSVDFTDLSFTNSDGSTFINQCNLQDGNFTNVSIDQSDVTRSSLTNTNATSSHFSDSILEFFTMTNDKFLDCDLAGAPHQTVDGTGLILTHEDGLPVTIVGAGAGNASAESQ